MEIDKQLSEFVFIAEVALNMRKDGFFSDGTWAGIEGGALALLSTSGGAAVVGRWAEPHWLRDR